jgi:hypothetical protein
MPTAADLTKQGIAAHTANDKPRATALFRQAIELDSTYEMAWLWLSSVLDNQAEKRFCLEQALVINPQSAGAERGLALLPSGITAQSPFAITVPTTSIAMPVQTTAISSLPRADLLPATTTTPTIALPQANTHPTITSQQGASKVTKPQAYFMMILICVGIGLGTWSLFFQPAPQWEYRTVSFTTEAHDRTGVDAMKYSSIQLDNAQLASLGAEGWELVGTYLEMETAYPNFGSSEYVTGLQPNIRPQEAVFIFKRLMK